MLTQELSLTTADSADSIADSLHDPRRQAIVKVVKKQNRFLTGNRPFARLSTYWKSRLGCEDRITDCPNCPFANLCEKQGQWHKSPVALAR